MNIHPLFVHFPIAFFTLYCIAELLRFSFITRQAYWFYIKASFVIVGSIAGLIVTIPTGILARIANVVGRSQQNIIVHEIFAISTVIFFTFIALCYIVLWCEKAGSIKISALKLKVAHSVVDSRTVLFLAIIGLMLVGITGALGGALVYGNNNDPFATFLTSILFK